VAGRTKLGVSGFGSGHEGLDAGIFTAAAVGRSVADRVSVEGELVYLHNNINTGDLNAYFGAPLGASARTIGGLVNAKYAVSPIGPLAFNVGAGLGYGETRYELLGDSASKGGLIWQLMADLAFPMNDTVTWNLQYRYLRSPEFKESVDYLGTIYNGKLETGTHVVALGAQIKF
jgi:opacity protein-like surface antigen